MQIEMWVLVQPRGSKNISTKNINTMDDAHDPRGHREDAMADVEDPICIRVGHMGKGM